MASESEESDLSEIDDDDDEDSSRQATAITAAAAVCECGYLSLRLAWSFVGAASHPLTRGRGSPRHKIRLAGSDLDAGTEWQRSSLRRRARG